MAKTKPAEFLMKESRYYQFRNFLDKGTLACFSNRSLDLGFASADIEKNRKEFLRKLGINYADLVCCQQPHGGKVGIVGKKDIGKGVASFATAVPDCDALVTVERNIPLAVFTADCLSIFIFATKRHAVGIVHAGWRGSKEEIIKNTLKAMFDKFGVTPGELLIGFGPAIRSCCYEVTGEFKDHFQDGLIEKDGKIYLDLVKINLAQLGSMGVTPENVFDCSFCTAHNNGEFFSYRKEGKAAGRMMSLVMLK
ncbi:MAG: peptidoglycan editing factor PgeF [Candidatus Omnitrophica bacterium]|nr:peptidoglycan editing factor PgeF [Candidatus Omnitrophota bacterium]MDD5610297.1 peptidoglycan editing factor PgeF [Candidatus Omnitrophota bacterium]